MMFIWGCWGAGNEGVTSHGPRVGRDLESDKHLSTHWRSWGQQGALGRLNVSSLQDHSTVASGPPSFRAPGGPTLGLSTVTSTPGVAVFFENSLWSSPGPTPAPYRAGILQDRPTRT